MDKDLRVRKPSKMRPIQNNELFGVFKLCFGERMPRNRTRVSSS